MHMKYYMRRFLRQTEAIILILFIDDMPPHHFIRRFYQKKNIDGYSINDYMGSFCASA